MLLRNVLLPVMRTVLLLLFIIITRDTFGQEEVYRFKNYSVEQGLSQSYVSAIIQDKTGYLWFGTADGLNRFDGYTFKVYKRNPSDSNTFNGKIIHTLLCDSKNRIWIGTRGGIDIYDTGLKQFNHITSTSNHNKTLPNDYINALLESSDGNIWIGTAAGLAIYYPSGDSISTKLVRNWPDKSVTALYQDSRKDIWIGGKGGVFRYTASGRAVDFFHLPPYTSVLPEQSAVKCITETADGGMLIGTQGYGLFLLSKESGMFSEFIPPGTVDEKDNSISSLLREGSGNIWIGTSKGLTVYNENSKQTRLFRSNPADQYSISAGFVSSLNIDSTGQLWIGTDGGGISKLNTRQKKFLLIKNHPEDKNSLSDNFVKSILKDKKGRLWIGVRKGLNKYDPISKKWKVYRYQKAANDANDNLVLEIYEDSDGKLWIGHIAGLSSFDPQNENFTNYPPKGLANDEKFGIHEILELNKDTLLIAAWTGIYVFKKTSKTFEAVTGYNNGRTLRGIPFYALANPFPGEYWAGTLDSGIYVLNENLKIIKHFKAGGRKANSLSGSSIKSFLKAGNSIYIATTNGLSLYRPQSNDFENYDERDGFANAFFYGVLSDDNGNLWLSHNKGLSRFTPSNKKVVNYSINDGLQSAEFNTGAYFKDYEGKLYFGGIGGVTVFHPDSIRTENTLPKVVLNDFKKFDQSVDLPLSFENTQSLELDYSDKVFSFQFFLTDFTNVEKNRFAYKLEGFESEWIYTERRREVRYTNIEDGEYIFRVKAANADGVWNEEGLAVKISISPPFWKQSWFIILSVIIVGGAYGGIVRYVASRKLKKKIEELERAQLVAKERTRISRDLHDEIGAQVTQITLFGEILKRETVKGGKPSETIDNITETSRRIAESLDNVVWAVNPDNDTIENFAGYLEQYISKTLEHAGIACRIDIPSEMPDFMMAADLRHNLLMVIKELINNIIKHANADMVEFSINQQENILSIILSDNGKGFTESEARVFGNGLKNMKNRIEHCGGNIRLLGNTNGGSTARIAIPLG